MKFNKLWENRIYGLKMFLVEFWKTNYYALTAIGITWVEPGYIIKQRMQYIGSAFAEF